MISIKSYSECISFVSDDYNRVVLDPSICGASGDYINASHIDVSRPTVLISIFLGRYPSQGQILGQTRHPEGLQRCPRQQGLCIYASRLQGEVAEKSIPYSKPESSKPLNLSNLAKLSQYRHF